MLHVFSSLPMILAFLGSLFIFAPDALAADADIAINEIGAFATSTHEWVEIYNKGSESIDLTDWKFWENNTNHGLSATGTADNLVAPGEYAVIVQNAKVFTTDHPNYPGSIFASSWSTLSENGEEIGLKNAAGNFIEQFTYLATNGHSLERKNVALADYSSTNWYENPTGDTLGYINSATSGITPIPTNTSESTPSRTAQPAGSLNANVWKEIKINEFVSDPGNGNEWIELYNPTDTTLDVTGGTLCDGRANSSCLIATLSGGIPAKGWLVVILKSHYLNNDGDTILLRNLAGEAVDQTTYAGDLVPPTGLALARKIDGADTNRDGLDWAVTTQPTAGSANIIIAPSISAESTNKTSSSVSKTSTPTSWATSTSPLIISELLPDPVGSDLVGEFIELQNISAAPVDLAGWTIGDDNKTFALSGTIQPNSYFVIERTTSGISLPNSTSEELRLYNPSGAAADITTYTQADEGISYSRGEKNNWFWTEEITKNLPNNLVKPDSVSILWKITAPPFAAPGEVVNFDAADSADPRGGRLFFRWDFGGSLIRTGAEASHIFATSGIYSVTLSASSTAGTTGQKKFSVTVAPGNSSQNHGVLISEIFPNPHGTDTSEFIEIYNTSASTINVSGWQLKNNSDTKFTFPTDTSIPAHETLTFYRTISHLALNNTGDTVELSSPQSGIIDRVAYTKSIDGSSYSRKQSGWAWGAPTPGRVDVMETNFSEILKLQTGSEMPSVLGTKIFSTNSIAAIRELPKGMWVTIHGTVAALPGVFSTQYFYITDGSSGIQIFSSKKTFPSLSVGDQVAIVGTMSELRGVPRVTIKNIENIKITGKNENITPELLALGEISEAGAGNLATATGEITKLTSSLLYLDDGDGELAVYFKTGAHINKQMLQVGDHIKITGILEKTESGWQLWPRGNDDISILESPTSQTVEASPFVIHYGLVTAGGLGLIGGTVVVKKRKVILSKLRRKKPSTP